MEQGKGQARGPAGSRASGTGMIAGSRGGEVCRSQQGGWCAGCGVPASVWVLLFSSRSNCEDGRGISRQVPIREQSLLRGFTQRDENRELVLWAREGLRR